MGSCRHFRQQACSGCTVLGLPYAEQLQRKTAHVRACLAPLGVAVAETIASPAPMGYRVSAKIALDEDRHGRKAVGFYRRGAKKVAHVLDCPAQEKGVNALVQKLFGDLRRIPFKFYDHQGRVFQKKRLKFLTVRTAPGGASGLIVSHTGADLPELARWLTKTLPPQTSVYETLLTPRDGDQIMGRSIRTLCGPKTFAFPLAGRMFEIAPGSFFQANFGLSGTLIERASAFEQPSGTLLDLYSGFGAYTMTLAPRFEAVAAVDGSPDAIDTLRRAAEAAGFAHVRAHAAFCETWLAGDEAKDVLPRVSHLIVNPPRGGLSRAVATALSKARLPALRELRYVSCNPETLARDLAVLKAQGLRPVRAEPLDMFPQTEHVEVVATLFA